MSPPAPQPLAPLVAALAADMRAKAQHQAERFGPVAALHALLLAIVARLFTRLEDMIGLWQQGLLPPPAASVKATAAPPVFREPKRGQGSSRPRRTQASGLAANIPQAGTAPRPRATYASIGHALPGTTPGLRVAATAPHAAAIIRRRATGPPAPPEGTSCRAAEACPFCCFIGIFRILPRMPPPRRPPPLP